MMEDLIQNKKLESFFPDILVVVCCLISVVLSVIESRLNTDAHHWGLMYANAADLNAGLIPYKQIFIQYGFLTTYIQNVSLNIFGNTVVSVGIITGIFYAANIYISYLIWQKVLNKPLAALASLLMFLVHGYIIYPWANYFSYTFLLLSILSLTGSSQKGVNYLFAGIFLALSFLARQNLLFILPPFYLYFLLIYISSGPDLKKIYLRNVVMFNLGLFVIIGVFLFYLVSISAFEDWIKQSFTIGIFYSHFLAPENILIFIKAIIIPFKSDGRLLLYSAIFLNALAIFFRIGFLKRLWQFKGHREPVQQKDGFLFLLSATTLFGYLQSLHLYEVFRLQNSSALGFGLLIFSLFKISKRFKLWECLVLGFPLLVLFFYLVVTLVAHKTSSVYMPWSPKLLLSLQLSQPKNIEMLDNKLYNEKNRLFYETLSKTINSYGCELDYLVNFTSNSYIPMLSRSYKKVQRAPFYNEYMSKIIFPDEQEKITKLLIHEKAVLVSSEIKKVPENYRVVLNIKNTEVPYFPNDVIYIAVPKSTSTVCKIQK
jgi:4-amino-4-deoxy-L-arabinose transferase-like glycosyltransferase